MTILQSRSSCFLVSTAVVPQQLRNSTQKLHTQAFEQLFDYYLNFSWAGSENKSAKSSTSLLSPRTTSQVTHHHYSYFISLILAPQSIIYHMTTSYVNAKQFPTKNQEHWPYDMQYVAVTDFKWIWLFSFTIP